MSTTDVPLTGGTFIVPMEVRWGDMDAFGHVNNTLFFRYFEQARIRLMERLMVEGGQQRPVLLAHASCDFLQMLKYPASISVVLQLQGIGRSSLALACWIASADDASKIYARGRCVLVNFDGDRSVPWTDADRQRLNGIFAE